MFCKHFSKLFQENNCYRVPLKKRYKLKSRSFTKLGLRRGCFYVKLQQNTRKQLLLYCNSSNKITIFYRIYVFRIFLSYKVYFSRAQRIYMTAGEESGRFLFSSKDSDSCFRNSRPEVFCKKGVLRNFAKLTGKHLCQSLFFIKKETLAEVFSCEFFKISEDSFFYRTIIHDKNLDQKSSLLISRKLQKA